MKFTTGVEFLDKQIEGIHPGLVILYESVGAGGREFALTSMLNNAGKYKTSYLAISKPRDVVEREIKLVFPERKIENIEFEILSFADFYFKDTLVPLRWVADKSLGVELLKTEKNVFNKLVEFFDNLQPESYVFIDSLTDLARIAEMKFGWENLIDILKGLRILCMKKQILLTMLLTSNVFERGKEEELLDQADGVVVFEWLVEKDSITRWMYFRKFLGLLPLIEKERIVKYNVRIDPALGFTISRVMRVL
ncbi:MULTISPECIES: hypothetical protein [unclassified Archaeoglobus]|jgi:hypothetical protein|uniref:hypothetical protein n=1 Tax=unclassified Archaeoglobus TaxID=2643606 RepID=UPI0025C26314|nr:MULTISPECIES: hypothetical protein [unclassified Archaeoglobus]